MIILFGYNFELESKENREGRNKKKICQTKKYKHWNRGKIKLKSCEITTDN